MEDKKTMRSSEPVPAHTEDNGWTKELGCECTESLQITELQPTHTGDGTRDSCNAGHTLEVNSRCQTQPRSTLPHPGTPPASPSYHRLLVLIGFDASDEVGLAVGEDSHQLIQRLLELAREGKRALGGV